MPSSFPPLRGRPRCLRSGTPVYLYKSQSLSTRLSTSVVGIASARTVARRMSAGCASNMAQTRGTICASYIARSLTAMLGVPGMVRVAARGGSGKRRVRFTPHRTRRVRPKSRRILESTLRKSSVPHIRVALLTKIQLLASWVLASSVQVQHFNQHHAERLRLRFVAYERRSQVAGRVQI